MKKVELIESKLMLSLIVLLSRLPFLGNGYGIDPDAWGIALSGLRWSREGVYQASRLPGYPVPELMASWIAPWAGSVGMNLASALLAVGTVVIFHDIARFLKVPRPGLAALAMSFLPAFFLNGVCGMDFAWSFFFFVAALGACLRERSVWAGLFLGLAIGSRLTYGAAILPLGLVLSGGRSGWQAWSWVKFGVMTLLVGVVCYVPVFRTYGFEFFKYYPTTFNLVHFIWKSTIGPFGILGVVALLVFAGAWFRSSKRDVFGGDVWLIRAGLLTVFIYLVAWIKLPEDPAYLLPLMPFLFAFMFSQVGPRAQGWICGLFILSPFLLHVYKDGFHIGGPAIYDYQRRKGTELYLEQVLTDPRLRDPDVVVVTGYFAPQIYTVYYERGEPVPGTLAGEITPGELEAWVKQGKRLFFLRGQEEYLRGSHGVDLAGAGGRLF